MHFVKCRVYTSKQERERTFHVKPLPSLLAVKAGSQRIHAAQTCLLLILQNGENNYLVSSIPWQAMQLIGMCTDLLLNIWWLVHM